MTRLVGVLEQVETYQARTFAAADAATSDTVVFVARVEPLFTETGSVTVDINGDEYTATPTADDVAPYITVDPPLVGAVAEDDPVTVVPAAEVKTAWVSFSEDEDLGELTDFTVPHNLKAYTALTDGPKVGDERVSVIVETDPVRYVVDVANRPVLLDAGALDPDTTVPPAALTDGNPPPGSPTPILLPFAVGSLSWMVDPVLNADPVRFRIYADTSDPVTIDADHLVDDSGSHAGSFDQINGVRLLPEDPTVDPDPIYVACVEYDADGSAAPSPASLPAIPRRAGTEEISVDWLYAGKIEVSQLVAGIIQAIILGLGDYIELDGPNSTITIFQDVDHQIPGVQLRSDGSVFRGRGEFDNLSILEELILRGTGHVATDGSLILDNGVGDPTGAPTLTAGPESASWPAPPAGYAARGICWDAAHGGGQWLRLIRRVSDGLVRVETINSSGTVTATTSLSDKPADANSITVIGSNWFVMMRATYGTGVQHWRARKYTTAGAVVHIQDGSIPIFGDRPCVGTDGSNLLVAAQTASAVSVLVWDDADIDTLLGSFTWSDTFDDSNLGYVGSGSYDFAGTRIVINAGNEVHVFTASGSTLTEQTASAFTLPATSLGGGFTWNGTYFFSHHGVAILNRYNGYYPGAGDTAYVAYTDTDTGSGNHTKASPIASVALVARWFVQAALGTEPAGAVTPIVYMKIATSTPAVTALLKRSETIASRNTLINPATAGGSALGTDSNTFGSGGTPGVIKSNSGGFEAHGDGTVKVASTLVVGEAWTAPTLTSSWVNFGSGYFNAGYRKTPNHVHLRGAVKSGGLGSANPIFTLPVGSRPTATVRQIVASSSGVASVEIDTSGRVYVFAYGASGSNASVCLDTIYFALD